MKIESYAAGVRLAISTAQRLGLNIDAKKIITLMADKTVESDYIISPSTDRLIKVLAIMFVKYPAQTSWLEKVVTDLIQDKITDNIFYARAGYIIDKFASANLAYSATEVDEIKDTFIRLLSLLFKNNYYLQYINIVKELLLNGLRQTITIAGDTDKIRVDDVFLACGYKLEIN